MRKFIMTLLLASSAAMPALAQDQDGRQREPDRSESAQGDEAHPMRMQRPQRADEGESERPQVSERANWSERGAERQRAVEQQTAHQPSVEQRDERRAWRELSSDQPAVEQRRDRQSWQQQWSQENGGNDARRAWRERVSSGDTDGRQLRRDVTSREGVIIHRDRDQSGDGRVTDGRGATERVNPYSRTTTRWSGQWRNDRTYDWRRHRDRHRSIYRLGYYRDPYGSRYRRFSIGFNLFPSYYRSSYWLYDPWMYRLPPAYGPYRWVRYYDDALLINIYSGQVVDVVYDFFW